jgi:nitrogen fixation NifU-like protein
VLKRGTAGVDRQQQIDFILDHYENPRHYGAIENATLTQKGGNPGCGDVVTFYLKLDGVGRIEDISFEGEGCTISQAGSSLVTEMFHGKTLEDVENTSGEVVLDILGRELAATRLKCATLGINTTKEAVRQARRVELEKGK